MFSWPATSGCSKACLYTVSHKKSNNWLRRTNIQSNLTPEIEHTLKPSNYDAKPWCLRLTAQKSKYLHRFWELDPEILHTFLICPCRPFYECFFFFPPPKMWGSSSPKYPLYIRQRKEEKKKSLKARQGHIKHVCKISGSNSQERRGHWRLKEFGVLCLNQPVKLTFSWSLYRTYSVGPKTFFGLDWTTCSTGHLLMKTSNKNSRLTFAGKQKVRESFYLKLV